MAKIPQNVVGTLQPAQVMFEQVGTGYIYDPADKTFKSASQVVAPLLQIQPGGGTIPIDKMVRTSIDCTKWKDGRYTAFYYKVGSLIPFDCTDFDIINGDWKPITPTDIVWRMMEARVGGGTVRQALEKIDAVYRWVSKQPGFTQ